MNETQVKTVLSFLKLSFKEFEEYMVGKTLQSDPKGNTIYFLHDIANFVRNKKNEKTKT